MDVEQLICPDCMGKGSYGIQDPNHKYPTQIAIQCERCYGDGIIFYDYQSECEYPEHPEENIEIRLWS